MIGYQRCVYKSPKEQAETNTIQKLITKLWSKSLRTCGFQKEIKYLQDMMVKNKAEGVEEAISKGKVHENVEAERLER